jgi:hypothetical protein
MKAFSIYLEQLFIKQTNKSIINFGQLQKMTKNQHGKILFLSLDKTVVVRCFIMAALKTKQF